MSRYGERIDDETTVEYGFDPSPVPGYFYSVEKPKETEYGETIEVVEAEDTRRMMITHENEDHMNRSQIVERLEELGVNEERVHAMAMDQPF